MRTFLLSAAALLVVGITSCEKCADCTCSGTWVYDFDNGISAENESIIRNIYDAEFQSDYADKSEEICFRRGEFDQEVEAYREEQRVNFSDQSTTQGGLPWSVSGVYECICVEQ